jgi:hypothetical protein
MPVVEGAYRLRALNAAVYGVYTDTVCLGYGDESLLGEHCRVLSCRRFATCPDAEKRGAALLGFATRMAFVCRKCLCNSHNALCHRHGLRQPPVLRNVMDAYPAFSRAIKPLFADYAFHPMIDRPTWLAKWPAGKQNAFVFSCYFDAILPSRVKAMVKWEVYAKMPTKARLIQFYRNLATQAEYAPEFTAAQKVICEHFRNADMGDGIDVTFQSGMTAERISDWMRDCVRRGARCYYERDGKAWDSTMGPTHAAFRQRVYADFDEKFAAFVAACDCVKGFSALPAGMFRYKVDFTVKSGHNDTTLGNSLINAAIAYLAFQRAGVRCSIIVAGDDLLVACYDDVELGLIRAYEAEYGIVPEARVFTSFAQTSFISGIFIEDEHTQYFVPSPGRLFERLWWSVKPPALKHVAAYQRGVALGLWPVCARIPALRVLLGKFLGSGKVGRSDKGYIFRGSEYEMGDVMPSMCLRYALSRADFEELEAWLWGLPPEPLLLVHPVLDRIAAVDSADIADRGVGIW